MLPHLLCKASRPVPLRHVDGNWKCREMIAFRDRVVARRAPVCARVAEVAHLMVDAGLVVLVCVIAPFASEREFARGRFAEGEFVELFVDAPLAGCERDPKGLSAKARAGAISNLTGIAT